MGVFDQDIHVIDFRLNSKVCLFCSISLVDSDQSICHTCLDRLTDILPRDKQFYEDIVESFGELFSKMCTDVGNLLESCSLDNDD